MLHRSAIGGCQGSGSLKICAPRASYAVACNQATRKNAPELLTPTASGSAACEPMKKDRRARDEAQCLAVSNPTADLSTHRRRKSVRTTRATSELVLRLYLRLLTRPTPARPRAKSPSVAGSGTDVEPQPLLITLLVKVQTLCACATEVHRIEIVPTVAAAAANFIFERIITPLPDKSCLWLCNAFARTRTVALFAHSDDARLVPCGAILNDFSRLRYLHGDGGSRSDRAP